MATNLRDWFSRGWWAYLLGGCTGWRHFWCRVKGHPNGVRWFNVGGLEPDYRCRDCGEDLG
jgi:hypothetical protein